MAAIVLVAIFGVFLAGRIQIAIALGLTCLIYMLLFMPSVALTVIPQYMYAGADSFALTAIPFFVLVGELMNSGGISRRLVDFTRTVVGHFTGGMGMVSLFASAIFSAFSGSAVANAAGTGAVTIPSMIRSGYPRGVAAAIESTASSLGAIIPPSIPMIVYGTIAGISVGSLFIAGYIPGIIFALLLGMVIRHLARKAAVPKEPKSSFRHVLESLRGAGPALLTPVIIMGGILGGVMTPTEAGAVGVVYSLIIARYVYRELSWSDLPRVLINTAVTTGVVMLVMTVASVFSWIMAFEMIPTTLAEYMMQRLQSPTVLLLSLIGLLLLLGTFMDTTSAIIILTPVIVPVATKLGVDPLLVGFIVTATLTFGVCTPPVGTVLFVTSSIARTSIEETSKASIPLVGALVAGLVLMVFFPGIVLWLPKTLGY